MLQHVKYYVANQRLLFGHFRVYGPRGLSIISNGCSIVMQVLYPIFGSNSNIKNKEWASPKNEK